MGMYTEFENHHHSSMPGSCEEGSDIARLHPDHAAFFLFHEEGL